MTDKFSLEESDRQFALNLKASFDENETCCSNHPGTSKQNETYLLTQQAKLNCPICFEDFPADTIEIHAEICSKSKEKNILVIDSSDNDEDRTIAYDDGFEPSELLVTLLFPACMLLI